MQERRLSVDGVPLRWLEHGQGDPVVLVHGIPTSAGLWRHVVPQLGGVRALSWELVGFGASWGAGQGRDISVRAQAGYLLHWLDALGIERAVLVGHDLGGGVAQIAAVERPARVAGIVLTNSIGYDSWPIGIVKAQAAMSSVVARLPQAVLIRLLAGFIRLGHDDSERARESIDEHTPHYDHPRGARAFARQISSLRTEDTLAIASRLPELGLPAAVVWGAADRFQTLDYGRRLADDLGAELDVVPDGKHFMPEDHPQRVATAVRAVVAEARTAPRVPHA